MTHEKRTSKRREGERESAEARAKTNATASTPVVSQRRGEEGRKATAKVDAKGKAREPLPKPEYTPQCPRCKSEDTKFCYYNNYNIKQPRFYCKECCRYWTEGGLLRNVRVGAGRRKSKSAKDKEAADTVTDKPAVGDDALGAKRSRRTGDDNRGREKSARNQKRDGSSDGSATEAEQGEGTFEYARGFPHGSNAGSDTAVRGRSPPEEQGSAEGEGSQRPGDHMRFLGGWGIDPSVARYVSTGLLPPNDDAIQAQAAAAAAASAAILNEATRWGMHFWNKQSTFPYNMPSSSSTSTVSEFPGNAQVGRGGVPTPIALAALKCERVAQPTPLHPTAAAAASTYGTVPRTQGTTTPTTAVMPSSPMAMQYVSMFQNPWAQFCVHSDKGFQSNPAMFQEMQQQMFNQQMAHFMQLHGGMFPTFGGFPGAPQPQQSTQPQQQEGKSEAEPSERRQNTSK